MATRLPPPRPEPLTLGQEGSTGEAPPNITFDWEFWKWFAGRYGRGPVTVKPSDPKWLSATAAAVLLWNRAAGKPVFRMVGEETKEPDIMVNFGNVPGTSESTGAAIAEPGEPSRGVVTVDTDRPQMMKWFERHRAAAERDPRLDPIRIVAHELGHTLGLGHPLIRALSVGGLAPVDWRQLMGMGTTPTRAEGKRLAKLAGDVSPGPSIHTRPKEPESASAGSLPKQGKQEEREATTKRRKQQI